MRIAPMIVMALSLLAPAGFSATLPLVFETNQGQTDPHVRYLARGPHSTLWLTEDGAVLGSAQGSLRIRFEGGNRTPRIEGEEALPGRTNYFVGNQPSRWRRDIPLAGKVRYRDVYPGVDALFYGNPQDLEYDLVVAPGGDPRKIRLAFCGARKMRLDNNGDLVFTVGSSEFRQHRPRVYQGSLIIEGRYALLGRNRVGFSVGAYDAHRALTIDPVLTYATFLGGSTSDTSSAATIDAQGNLYLTGIVGSPDFPVFGGLNQTAPNSRFTVGYIAKINSNASGAASLVWSTFIGSTTQATLPGSIAIDANGNVYSAGVTVAVDFPIKSAFQTSPNCAIPGQSNCVSGFVMKVASSGNQLLYSSYLGGGIIDLVNAIAVDGAGNAYVAGTTQSPNFPLRGSPYQGRLLGHANGFFSQISSDGSTLLYSTFLGGEGTDQVLAVAVDSRGVAYLGGQATSAHFPVTQDAYQSSLQGAAIMGFICKLDPSQGGMAGLLYSSYIGGNTSGATTSVKSVTTDSVGAFIGAGFTTDSGFPVTPGAFQSKFGGIVLNDPGGSTGDAFVIKLNPLFGTAQLQYSSFFGGAGNDSATAVSVDGGGRILIAGSTGSSNLTTTADAFECCFANPGNLSGNAASGFVARVDPSKSGPASLIYSTYLGGTNGGIVNLFSATVNNAGTVAVVSGNAKSNNLPVTASAYQKFAGKQAGSGASNAYIAKFDLTTAGPLIAAAVNGASFLATGLSPGLIFTLTGTGLGPAVGVGPQVDNSGRVSTSLAGIQVLVDGVAAPLLYVSGGQINAVAPYALSSKLGKIVFVQVISNGTLGNVFPVSVIDTAPGIFVSGGGQGAILNQDFGYNGANNPAAKGTYVSIFMTGEGSTNPAVPDGHIASETVDKLARPVAPVSVKIGGVAVGSGDMAYAGAAPQNVAGLLQITVKIPPNAPSGNVPVVVTIGSNSSQAGVTVAVQ